MKIDFGNNNMLTLDQKNSGKFSRSEQRNEWTGFTTSFQSFESSKAVLTNEFSGSGHHFSHLIGKIQIKK